MSTQINTSEHDGLIGQTLFGSYAVLQLIGEGPMSRVYLAKHVASEQLVALKTLTRSEPELIEAFAKDARSNHKLDHPNIVRTLGYFEAPNGAPFVVLEFIEGITLSELLEVHLKIDKDEELTNVMFQVCDALAFAHENRVLHANLKPQNVMIFERDSEVLVKVANFGSNLIGAAIRLADDNLVEYPHDPGTLSPEQLLEGQLNPQTDVYWLGALTYRLASGCVPYNTRSVAELVSKFRSNADVTPLAELNTQLRSEAELGSLLHDSLSRDPQKRPPSIQVFKERLNTWLKSSQYAKEAQVPSFDLQSAGEFRSEEDIMNRRATREVLTASIHNLVILRQKQVDQEETVMMQFTSSMAAKGPRQSPTKTAVNMVLVVSTIAFFFVSLTFYLFTNGDELRAAWTNASRQLSTAIWGAKKETPAVADDEFIIEEPVASSPKGRKKLSQPQHQIAAAENMGKPAEAAQTRQIRFKYEEDPFYSKWITHDKFTDVRRLETE